MNMTVVNNLIIIFAMIGVGFVSGRTKIVSERASGDFTSFLMKVTLPCTIFGSMLQEFDPAMLKDSILIFILGLVFFGGLNLVNLQTAKLLRVTPERRSVWVVAASMSNSGFMGFPLALAIFGTQGLFLASMMNIGYNCIAWSLCAFIIGGDSTGGAKVDWKRIVFTNANYAVVLGLIFFIGQFPVPDTVRTVVTHFGNITTPLSMFLIGLSLAGGRLSDVIRDRDVIKCILIRLVVVPLAVVGIFRLLPFPQGSLVAGVATLILSMPCPSVALMLSEEYHKDSTMAAGAIFVSSFFCIFTIPVVLMLLGV